MCLLLQMLVCVCVSVSVCLSACVRACVFTVSIKTALLTRAQACRHDNTKWELSHPWDLETRRFTYFIFSPQSLQINLS